MSMKPPIEQEPFRSTVLIRYGYGSADSWEWHIDLERQADSTYALSMVQLVTDPPSEEAVDERELSPFTSGAELCEFVRDVFQEHEDPLSHEEWTEMIDAIAVHDALLARQVKDCVREKSGGD